jgi:hypothetical protein
MNYEVKITAIGQVRDAEGNLLSEQPYTETVVLTESELLELVGETK